MAEQCTHLGTVEQVTPSSEGCEDCLRTGGRWVHLRLCMRCGHVGCCDSSPNRHATAHAGTHADHPLIRSYEPGEDWWWCYPDQLFFDIEGAPPSPSHPCPRGEVTNPLPGLCVRGTLKMWLGGPEESSEAGQCRATRPRWSRACAG